MSNCDMVLQAAAVCHKGKVRANNEDNLIFDRKILRENHEGVRRILNIDNTRTNVPQLFGVFDGMGGHSKGEKASFLAAAKAGKSFKAKLLKSNRVADFLSDICFRTNEEVCKEMRSVKARMGTTASMLYFYLDRVWICNIGDSPIYRMRNGHLEAIFEEHTERLMREKIYGKEKAKGKKYKYL